MIARERRRFTESYRAVGLLFIACSTDPGGGSAPGGASGSAAAGALAAAGSSAGTSVSGVAGMLPTAAGNPNVGGSVGAAGASSGGGESGLGGGSASGASAQSGALSAGANGGGLAASGSGGGIAPGGNGGGLAGGGAQGEGQGGSAPTAGAGGAAGTAAGALSGLPKAAAVLASMRLANDQFAAKWPDPTVDIVTDRARPSNLWTRAVYYEGLLALHAVETEAARRTRYYDYAVRWGASPSHPWGLAYGDNNSTNADNQACGQVYVDLYLMDRQPERLAVIQANVDRQIAQNALDVWTWIDAIQMAMPLYAKLGVLRNEPRYFDAMWALYANSRNTQGGGLFNEAAGLWWRDANYSPGGTYTRSPNGADIYWSRGNGWVIAALVRVLDILPATDAHRATYEADLRAIARALVPLQRTDGFWHESLTNPTHCASIGKAGEDGPEASGTALFAYALAWGVRKGLLDAATYGPVVVRAWNGLVETALHTNGFLGWVQSTGAAPCDNTTRLGYDVVPNFEDYGVGTFLLAGSEVSKLAPQ